MLNVSCVDATLPLRVPDQGRELRPGALQDATLNTDHSMTGVLLNSWVM